MDALSSPRLGSHCHCHFLYRLQTTLYTLQIDKPSQQQNEDVYIDIDTSLKACRKIFSLYSVQIKIVHEYMNSQGFHTHNKDNMHVHRQLQFTNKM